MELEFAQPILKKIKISQLEPGLQNEIFEVANEMGWERTLESSNNLHAFYRLYQKEKVREKGNLKRLQKAENIILKLSMLGPVQAQRKPPPTERTNIRSEGHTNRHYHEMGIEVRLTDKLKEVFESLGIGEEKIMKEVVLIIGGPKIEERAGLIHASNLGDGLVKALFRREPKMMNAFCEGSDEKFVSEVDALDKKKEIIRSWAATNPLPIEADYSKNPGVLFETYHELSRLLKLEVPETGEREIEKEGPKYRGKPMDPKDFMKVAVSLGFAVTRETKHGIFMQNQAGRIMIVQRAHRKQEQLNSATIKKKLVEARVDLDEFEKKRRELSL